MAIFKYELRQVRGYILAWSLTLAAAIIVMLPVYMGFIIGSTMPADFLTGNEFFNSIGVNMKYLGTPLGVYGFLTSFALIAGAINGMHLGVRVFTKEYMQKTADYIMTKPYNRTKVYFSKLAAAACACILIGAAFGGGSLAAVFIHVKEGVDLGAFSLMAFSFVLMQLLFVAVGAFTGTVFPGIRTPLSTASGVAFVAYVLGAFSRKTNNAFTSFFSPYIYFDNGRIMEKGSYDPRYMAAFIILLAAFTVIGYRIYVKKDVVLVS